MSKEQDTSCCFCCHVNVGTLLLAIFFLIGGIFGIVMSSLLLTNTVQPQQFMMSYVMDYNTTQVYEYKPSTIWVALGNGVLLTIIALSAIYGLLKSRAGFLLPLFILQLFNFVCTIVYAGSILFYWNDLKSEIAECQHIPEDWKVWFENLDDHWLGLLVFTVLLIVLFIKSYLITVTYRSYKHITVKALRHQRRHPEISCIVDDYGKGPIYKPPKYEEIQKVPLVSDVEVIDSRPPPYIA